MTVVGGGGGEAGGARVPDLRWETREPEPTRQRGRRGASVGPLPSLLPSRREMGGPAGHLPDSQRGLFLSPAPQETKGSVAVRVALGETQLVQEVRRFLVDNGVSLDSFSQVGLHGPAQLLDLGPLSPAGSQGGDVPLGFRVGPHEGEHHR